MHICLKALIHIIILYGRRKYAVKWVVYKKRGANSEWTTTGNPRVRYEDDNLVTAACIMMATKGFAEIGARPRKSPLREKL